MLSLSNVTAEMTRLIHDQIRLEHDPKLNWFASLANQYHVQFILEAVDLSKTLDNLSDERLTPAAVDLVQKLNQGNARYCFELPVDRIPSHIDWSRHRMGGVSLRGIVDREYRVTDDQTGMIKTVNLFRFDILWAA